MTTKPTLGQILGMAGGALLFIFGFLDWYGSGAYGQSGWDTPIGNWAPLLGIITAAVLAAVLFLKIPQLQKMDLKPSSLMLAAGLLLSLDTFSFLIADHAGGTEVGLVLSFLAALVLLAGGILDTLGVDPIAGSRNPTGSAAHGQQPGYGQPPAYGQQPGYAQQPGSTPPAAYPPPPQQSPPPAPPAAAPPPAPGGTTPPPPPTPGQGF